MEELSREGPFDLLLTDTSLFQSITAAIQSVKGKKVLQIDQNSFYGGPQAGTNKIPLSSHNSFILHDPSPIIFYARGPISDLLLSLDLAEYIEFTAIDEQFIWPSERMLIPLPLSKEQVMLEPSLTLLEKRKLSKLLGFAALLAAASTSSVVNQENRAIVTLGDLLRKEGVNPESRVFQLIAYGACRCSSPEEVDTLSIQSTVSILESLRESINHLSGRGSPFVLPLWGSSELSQAACRKAAVFGCTQILGTFLHEIQTANIQFKSSVQITETRLRSVFRAAWLLDQSVLGLSGNVLITIPPSSDLIPDAVASAISVLQLSSDSKCCPPGTWIVYLWSESPVNSSRIVPLIIGVATILWSSPLEEISVPFYKHSNDRSEAICPFQPISPASFTSEQDFLTSLRALNEHIMNN